MTEDTVFKLNSSKEYLQILKNNSKEPYQEDVLSTYGKFINSIMTYHYAVGNQIISFGK